MRSKFIAWIPYNFRKFKTIIKYYDIHYLLSQVYKMFGIQIGDLAFILVIKQWKTNHIKFVFIQPVSSLRTPSFVYPCIKISLLNFFMIYRSASRRGGKIINYAWDYGWKCPFYATHSSTDQSVNKTWKTLSTTGEK